MSDQERTAPRRVDPLQNADDFRCILLGSLGMSTKAIEGQTDLTHCQITYRLNKYKIKRTDYRNGTSDSARYVMAKVQSGWARELEAKLRLRANPTQQVKT